MDEIVRKISWRKLKSSESLYFYEYYKNTEPNPNFFQNQFINKMRRTVSLKFY